MSNIMKLSAALVILSAVATVSAADAKSGEGREGFWKRSVQGAPSIAECSKRLEANPKDADAANDLGWAYRQNGKPAEAEKFLRQAIELKPDMPQAHSNLSVVLNDQKNSTEAIAEARKAIAIDAKQPIYQVVLGNALAESGDLKAAADAYKTAIQLRPDYENAHYNLGRVLQLDGQVLAAQQALSQAIVLDPKDDRAILLLDQISISHTGSVSK